MQALRQQHAIKMAELRQYLEETISIKYKPSCDVLNLRKIEYHLSKQKNYTEAKKVQKTLKALIKKESSKCDDVRTQKIHV